MDELMKRQELLQALMTMTGYFRDMIQADKSREDGTLVIVTPGDVRTLEEASEIIRTL